MNGKQQLTHKTKEKISHLQRRDNIIYDENRLESMGIFNFKECIFIIAFKGEVS